MTVKYQEERLGEEMEEEYFTCVHLLLKVWRLMTCFLDKATQQHYSIIPHQ